MRTSLLLTSVVLLAAVGACDEGKKSNDPLPTEQTRSRVVNATDRTLVAFDHAFTFVTTLEAVEAMTTLSGFASSDEASDDSGNAARLRARVQSHLQASNAKIPLRQAARRLMHRFDPRAKTPQHRRALREQGSSEIDEMRAELKEFLAEKVFIDANVESVDGGTTTYLLPGALFCTYASDSPETGTEGDAIDDFGPASEEVDAECVAQIDAIEIRLAVKELGDDGIAIDVLIGAPRHHPLKLELEPQRLAETVDLAEVLASLKVVSTVTGEETWLPQELSGKESCEVETPSEQVFHASCSILEPVTFVEPKNADDPASESHPLEVHVAAADPYIWMAVDAQAKSMEGGLDMHAVDVNFADTPEADTELHLAALHVDGLSVQTRVQDGDSTLQLTELGIGEGSSYLDYDAQRLITIDFNREHGRNIDVSISPDAATDSAVVGLSGTLTFDMSVNDALAAGVTPSFINAADLHSVSAVVDGDAKPELVPYLSAEGDDVLLVRKGHLKLSDALRTVEVAAAACLLSNPDDASIDPNSPVSAFVSGVCPAAQL